MKTAFVLLLFAFSAISLSAQADLNTALGQGDVEGISAHLGDKVEMTILGKEEVLPKAQAVVRLREFYAGHAARGFKIMHKGNSQSKESDYQIGELVTGNGNYRVYLYFTQKSDQRQVVELRIEQ